MKLYVLSRADLAKYSKSYPYVQAGHAVAEFLLRNPNHDWKNHTLVYLQVPDEHILVSWVRLLKASFHEPVTFREPDIGDEMTAIAVYSNGKVMSELPLL